MADRKEIEQAIREARAKFAPLIKVFSSPMGQDAMELLMEQFVHESSYTKGDPYHTAFLEGQRALVLWIRDVVNKHGDMT